MTTPEKNKEIVERASFESYSEGNMDIIDELVSDDFVLHESFPLLPEETRGRDGLKEHVEVARSAFSDASYTMEHMVAEDDFVAAHYTLRGTHDGPIPGLDLAPTGEEFEIIGMEFDRIEDGKLVETWYLLDTLGFLQQVGALPAGDISPAQ